MNWIFISLIKYYFSLSGDLTHIIKTIVDKCVNMKMAAFIYIRSITTSYFEC